MSNALTAAGKKTATVKRNLRSVLERGIDEFAMVIPCRDANERHVLAERLVRVAMTAATMQPELLDCTPESVGLALLTASQVGLEPDGYNAHLIPYGKTCQFIPDYKGLIQLALEHGVTVDAHVVYEHDRFEYQLGTNPMIIHVPIIDGERGDLLCAYAVATLENGNKKFVVATREDIEKRRDMSKGFGGKNSPWKLWEEEMWMKTSVKMLSKFIPRSKQMKGALVADNEAESGTQNGTTEIFKSEVVEKQSRTEYLQHMLNTREEKTKPLDEPLDDKTEEGKKQTQLNVDPDLAKSSIEGLRNAMTGADTKERANELFDKWVLITGPMSANQMHEARDIRECTLAVISGEIK